MSKKLRVTFLSLFVMFSFPSFASVEEMKDQIYIEECENLACIRSHIDLINQKIVMLLVERMQYVLQAGKVKLKNNILSANDSERAQFVIKQAESLGREKGLPPGFAEEVFQLIVSKSISLEQEFMDSE